MRPLWICRTCASPWPCATARLTLTAEYADRVALCIYLAGMLHSAIDDLYRLNPPASPDPTGLFDRFLGWASPRRHHRTDPDLR